MKRYLLDTNICVFYLKGKYDLLTKIEKIGRQHCFISEITVAELLYGASCSNDKERVLSEVNRFINQFEVLPIYESLSTFADAKAQLRKEGILIDNFDLLIGVTAIHHKLIMVTENVKHLNRLPQIKIENWINR